MSTVGNLGIVNKCDVTLISPFPPPPPPPSLLFFRVIVPEGLTRLPLCDASIVDLTGDSDVEEFIDLSSSCSIGVRNTQNSGWSNATVSQDQVPYAVNNVPPSSSSHWSNTAAADGDDDDDDVIFVSSSSATLVPPSYSVPTSHLVPASYPVPTSHPAPPPTTSVDLSRPEYVVAPPTPQIEEIIKCPICMETQTNFSHSGHFLVSTKCGHLFCDNCLLKHMSTSHKCPTCKCKLTKKQYHRIYV